MQVDSWVKDATALCRCVGPCTQSDRHGLWLLTRVSADIQQLSHAGCCKMEATDGLLSGHRMSQRYAQTDQPCMSVSFQLLLLKPWSLQRLSVLPGKLTSLCMQIVLHWVKEHTLKHVRVKVSCLSGVLSPCTMTSCWAWIRWGQADNSQVMSTM